MPAVLKIDPQRRIACSTFYGEVSDEDLIRHRSTIADDPAFNRDFSEIVDFSAVTKSAISPNILRALSSTPSLFNESVLHVIVACGPLADIAREYQALARTTRPNLFVVQSLQAAYELLRERPSG